LSTATGDRGATLPLLVAMALLTMPARSGEVEVLDTDVDCSAGGCRFAVTLRHDDTGWDHYADHWRVLTPGGDEIARRVLYHPHVDEQPFTRSLDGVVIPSGMRRVIIEGHDTVHGYGGGTLAIELP
jgi:hypothetical protein